MTSRFLFLMISFLSLYFPFSSQGMDLVEGLNEWVLSSCATHKRPFNERLLSNNPKLIQNNRFLGNLTNLFNPEFSPHPQCISTSSITYFPGDAMTSLLQHLFPSPDGVLLVANQTGDSVGKLDPRKMGRLLKLIEDYPSEHADEITFKRALYDLLLDLNPEPKIEKSRLEKYPKLLTEFSEFCVHDFKITFLQNLKSLLDLVDDEELEKNSKVSRQDPLFLTKILKLILLNASSEYDFFESSGLKEGELEAYNEALTSKTELTSRLHYFRNKEKDFKTVRFIEVLVKALNEERLGQPHLPSFLVEHAVFSFFWQKAKTPDNLINFLSSYLEIDPESLRTTFPTTVFSEKDYWDIRNDPTALENTLLDPKRSSFLYLGYDLFENPLPLLLQYQTTSYKGKNFPDCIETLFANFTDIVCRIKRTELAKLKSQVKTASGTEEPASEAPPPSEEILGHVFTAPFLPQDHPLNIYYEWLNENPELRFSQERRDRWATLCSALPHIRYLKSTQGKEGEKDYELAPGLINFLNVVRYFFGIKPNSFPFEENEKQVSESLDTLCTLLSRQNFRLTWEGRDLSYNALQNDYFDTVTFLINEKKAFTLTIEMGAPGHGYIKRFPEIEEDWRQKVDIDLLKKTLPPEALASFLTTPEAFEKAFSIFSPQDQITLVHSLDLDALDMKLAVIKASYLQNPSLKPLAKRLMGLIAHLNDNSATEKLLRILIPLSILKDSPLEKEEMETLFRKYPGLLNSNIEDPFHPNIYFPGTSNNHLVLFALKHGKTEWLKSLPHIETLILGSVLREDVLLEFFKTYLSSCTKLNYFIVSPALNEKGIENLSFSLSHLTSLSNLAFWLEGIDFGSLRTLFTRVNPDLQELSVFFEGIDSWVSENGRGVPIPNKDAWKQIIPHLHFFFKTKATTIFKLKSNSAFSEIHRAEIREILNISQFPEGKFNLIF